jgi:hypothetical protein
LEGSTEFEICEERETTRVETKKITKIKKCQKHSKVCAFCKQSQKIILTPPLQLQPLSSLPKKRTHNNLPNLEAKNVKI